VITEGNRGSWVIGRARVWTDMLPSERPRSLIGVPAERGGMTVFSGSSSMPRIRPGHQDPLRRRTQTSAPTSASGPVTPPGHSSPAQLPITLYVCNPYLSTTIASRLLPPLIKSRDLLCLSKRSGGALEPQRTLVRDGSASPGGDGCLVEAVLRWFSVCRWGEPKRWKERRGQSPGKEEDGSGS
jgi:hypothetical protein